MQGLDWLKQGVWSVLLCIAAGLFFLGGAEAAVTWEKNYGEIYGRGIEPTTDGGYASFGFFLDGGKFSTGVLKLDALGNVEWYRKYDLANADDFQATALKSTRDGGFILCGRKWFGTTNSAWVMKLDDAGNVLWTKTYKLAVPPNYSTNKFRNNSGVQIIEADDGGYIFLAGDEIRTVWTTKEQNLWLIKLDRDGDIQWQKTLAASASDWAKNLLKTKDDAYLVTAHTNLGLGITNSLVLKLDADGTITWAKTYSGTGNNFVHSLTELNGGNFAVAGISVPQNPSLVYPWVVKLDANGNIIWQKEYSTNVGNSPVRILPSADNGFLLTHTSLLKLDSVGTAQWSTSLGYGTKIWDFQTTTDGGYVMAKSPSFSVSKLDANAESCLPRSKTYLTTTIENNFSVADASIKTIQTDALPVSVDVVSKDISPPTPYLYCISALPEIAVDATALDYGFGSVEVLTSATANVFVSNICGAALNVSAMTITGANAGDFSLTTDCSAVVAGGSCTAEIIFAPSSLGTKLALLTITSDDPKQPKIEIPLSGQVVDTVAPVITLLGQEELTVEAGSVYVDAGATALDNYDGNLTTAIVTDNPVNSTVVGTYLVTYDVADASGNRTQLLRTVHVVDTIAPEVSLSVDRSLLWPPNHKLVDILVNGSAQDGGSGLLSVVLSVTDEYGKYNLTLPAFGSTVALEAWRDGQDKDGRVYTLTAVATDRAGNVTTRSSNILVPHDMGK